MEDSMQLVMRIRAADYETFMRVFEASAPVHTMFRKTEEDGSHITLINCENAELGWFTFRTELAEAGVVFIGATGMGGIYQSTAFCSWNNLQFEADLVWPHVWESGSAKPNGRLAMEVTPDGFLVMEEVGAMQDFLQAYKKSVEFLGLEGQKEGEIGRLI